MPRIVNANVNTGIVRLQVDIISLDSCVKVNNPISADSTIDKLIFGRMIRTQRRLYQIGISIAQIIKAVTRPAAICYGISLK